ncbi:type IV pilin protein [sulfur-oxidizing endosymbiont of Gigantopelta aegis]|uniref:type IV pilin protein n=1 Tax=sulfur-oxidizing endosymbiont of Gigantopelta aegis TaxID=2794934 RepID=UPI0018DC9216|nr:type IV pilin protein [sulfur-oxidizing endosymbiont of Gigantopelta aegis]
MKKKLDKVLGFTLIELMIVIAIISILAAIAAPAYQEYIRKAKRADAQGALYGLASTMERFYTENNTYCGSENGGVVGTCVAGGDPGSFSATVPVDGGVAYYDLTISLVTANTYTLEAARAGSMAGDDCGDFTLTHTNFQGITNNTASLADCWR